MSSDGPSIDHLFSLALKLSPGGEREEFLDRECGHDPELRKTLGELLSSSHEVPTGFLNNLNVPTHQLDHSSEADKARTLAHPSSTHSQKKIANEEELPRRFGDYELLAKVGQGGMGVVYKARQVSLNRTVALKMILAGQLAQPEEVKRFHLEAEAAAGLDHQGIVPVYEAGCIEGQHYFAMGFVDGPSLSERISDHGMPPRDAARNLCKIAKAVQVAHDRGIVHRDLKPSNILLDSQGEPRITDFGLAKQVEGASDLTATGMVIGTPSYMPPEQAAGQLDAIKASSDVYSLGALFYTMLTGKPPFKGKSQVDTLLRVLKDEPVPPRQIHSVIPKDLEVICLKCLEKDPQDRYENAADVATDLQNFLQGEPIGAKNDWKRRFRKWTIREPVLAAHLGCTMVMMLFILINYLFLRNYGSGVEHSFHLLKVNWAILIASAFTVFVLQKLQNHFRTRYVIPTIWAAINPVFISVAIAVNDPPRSPLFSLYLLLMISMCFFRRVELVAVSSACSLLGFLTLLAVFYEEETKFAMTVEGTPRSYLVILGVTIAISGVILCLLAKRMHHLSQND